jgi:hypothetical protein
MAARRKKSCIAKDAKGTQRPQRLIKLFAVSAVLGVLCDTAFNRVSDPSKFMRNKRLVEAEYFFFVNVPARKKFFHFS